MNIESLDSFLCQSAKKRYSTIIVALLLVLSVCYYLLVVQLNDEYSYLTSNNQTLSDDINALNAVIERYSTYEKLLEKHDQLTNQLQQNTHSSANFISLLHEKLVKSQLTLIDLTSKKVANHAHYQIQTQGMYQDIIALMNELVLEPIYVDVNRISIFNDNNMLSFNLLIIVPCEGAYYE